MGNLRAGRKLTVDFKMKMCDNSFILSRSDLWHVLS